VRKTIRNLLLLAILIICPFIYTGCFFDDLFNNADNPSWLQEPFIGIDYLDEEISWEKVEDASLYDVFINDKYTTSINTTAAVISFDYKEYTTQNAVYRFEVVAKTNDGKVKSNKSNTIHFNNTNAFKNNQPSDYTFEEGLSVISKNSHHISWNPVAGIYKYVITLFSNETGSLQILQDETSFNLSNSDYGLGNSHQIIAYNVGYLESADDTSITLLSERLEYHNPDIQGMYTQNIFLFEGNVYDYYINNKTELNTVVYYNFINKTEEYSIKFDSEYALDIYNRSYTDKESAINNEISDSFESFYETCYYKSGKYKTEYSGATNLANYEFCVSINFEGIYECDTNKILNTSKNYTQYPLTKPYYETYDFSANGSRSSDYDEFPSDNYFLTQKVNTSEQLYHAVEHKITPICEIDSRAALIYDKAKQVLRTIISDNMTDYEKALSIFDWITINTIYDYSSEYYSSNYNFTQDCCYYLEGVFLKGVEQSGNLKGVAVCDGFSKAYSLLCNMEGIDCKRIVGTATTASGEGGHAWNKVKIDGNYYLVDITWTEILTDDIKNEILSHKYFLVSEFTTKDTHEPHINKDRYFEYSTPLTNFSYYQNRNIEYVNKDNQTIISNLYIDSSEKLENVLNYMLYENNEALEIAISSNYVLELFESSESDTSPILALQNEMRKLKYSSQLITQTYDIVGDYYNYIPINTTDSYMTAILQSSLYLNELGEMEKAINHLSNYANVNPAILNMEHTIAIELSYITEVIDFSGTLATFENNFTEYFDLFLSKLDSTSDFRINFTNTKDSFNISTDQGVTKAYVYYFELKINEPFTVQQLCTPQVNYSSTTIYWDSINNASAYQLYIDDILYDTIQQDGSYTYSYNLLNVFPEDGMHKISVVAISDSEMFTPSQACTIDYNHIIPVKLTTPVVNLNDTLLTWYAVENANSYEIYNDTQLLAITSDTSINLDIYISAGGTYTIGVKAISDNSKYIASNLGLIVYKQLNAPTLSISNSLLTWHTITNAHSYQIFIDSLDNQNFITTEGLSFDIASYISDYKPHTFYVRAIHQGFGSSEYSHIVYQLYLTAPTVTLNDNLLSWQAEPKFNYYEIYCNEQKIEETKDNEIDLSQLITKNGTYQIYVNPIALEPYKINTHSNTVEYIVNNHIADPITAPIISLDWLTSTISWNAVNNANYYNIYVDNVLSDSNCLGNSYNLEKIISDFEPHKINITANNNQEESSMSNDITFELTSTSSYYIDNSLSYRFYENSTIVPDTKIDNFTISWDSSPIGDFCLFIYTASNGVQKIIPDTNEYSFYEYYKYTLNSDDFSDILAYYTCVNYRDIYFVDEGYQKYFNPNNNSYNAVYSFEGEFNDYCITSQEELNHIVYYMHTKRLQSIDVLVPFVANSTEMNSALNIATNSFSETCSYTISFVPLLSSTEGSLNITYYNGENSLEPDIRFYEDKYYNETQIHPTQFEQSEFTNAFYKSYNYSLVRDKNHVYPTDTNTIKVNVSGSEELYKIVEAGYTPVCEKGSRAYIIYNIAKAILADIIDNQMSDYEKALTIFDWISMNTKYDHTYSNSYISSLPYSNPSFYLEGVFLTDSRIINISEQENFIDLLYEFDFVNNYLDCYAVCDGFSKAYSLLCRMEGIDCIKVTGTVPSGGHAWNKVKIDNNYYLVDITWSDMLCEMKDESKKELISHKYFLVTDEFCNTHVYHPTVTRFENYKTPSTPYNAYSNLYINNNKEYDSCLTSTTEFKEYIDFAHSENVKYLEFVVTLSFINEYDKDITTESLQMDSSAATTTTITKLLKEEFGEGSIFGYSYNELIDISNSTESTNDDICYLFQITLTYEN